MKLRPLYNNQHFRTVTLLKGIAFHFVFIVATITLLFLHAQLCVASARAHMCLHTPWGEGSGQRAVLGHGIHRGILAERSHLLYGQIIVNRIPGHPVTES